MPLLNRYIGIISKFRHEPSLSYGAHYVLKTPFVLSEIEAAKPKEDLDVAIVANGCFWGSEKTFWRMPGVYTTAVGYTGGVERDYPSYENVCTGVTGHTEAVLVVWDKSKLSFVDILRMFLQSHDPTQVNGQGNDRGTQYRGGIYYLNETQKRVAEEGIRSYSKSVGRELATEIKEFTCFYYAEEYHQQYLSKPFSRPYCSAQPLGIQLADFRTWLPEDCKDEAPKLKEDFWAKYSPTYHCVLRDPHEQIMLQPNQGSRM